MEDLNLLEKISSKYIKSYIISYIEDEYFLYKFFLYSKLFQKKMKIQLLDYKKIYNSKKIDYEKYLDIYFDTNELKNLFSKYEINEYEFYKFAIHYFKKYLKNKDRDTCLYEYSKDISYNSPLFNVLSKTEIFDKLFNIKLRARHFFYDKEEKENILSTFNKLNESNINYSSINCYIHNAEEVNILDNVNLNHIKKLSILIIRDQGKYDLFFKTFFLIKI